MPHKKIHRFQLEGTIASDADIPRTRYNVESTILTHMRNTGYIPLLDLDPSFSTEYTDDTWTFKITIHGIYVGKKKASMWEGMFMDKPIVRSNG